MLNAHVHPSAFARLSFCFKMVHLLDAVFWLAVISQMTIHKQSWLSWVNITISVVQGKIVQRPVWSLFYKFKVALNLPSSPV